MTEGWVSSRSGPGISVEREISCRYRESNQGSSVVKPISWSLYRLRYPSINLTEIFVQFMAQWWTGENGVLELTKSSINCVVRMTLWNSASWVDWDGQDMSYARMTMVYPGESSSAS
jgi:hypothetical protein